MAYGTRILLTATLLLLPTAVLPPCAQAINVGPADYFIVQQEIENIVVKVPGSSEPIKITLHKGQLVSLKSTLLGDAAIPVEKVVNGRTIKTEIKFPRSQIGKLFGSPLNPGSHRPEQLLAERPTRENSLRLDFSPDSLGETYAPPGKGEYLNAQNYPMQTPTGGTEISLEESKIIDIGRGGVEHLVLAHRICLEPSRWTEKCGWVRNDFLSQGDPSEPRYNFSTPEVSAHVKVAPPPCPRRDTFGHASHLAAIIAETIHQLPRDEQNARDTIRKAVGLCAVKPPALDPWKLPTAALDAIDKTTKKPKNINVYEGLARPTAMSAYSKIAGAASKALVRNGAPAHPLTREEFVTIDAFARTLFAEMRRADCSSKPYMEAVARTIMNRGLNRNADRFRRNTGLAKNPILQAIVSDQAYSVWNNDDEVAPNAPLARREIAKYESDRAKAEATAKKAEDAWEKAEAARVAKLKSAGHKVTPKKKPSFEPKYPLDERTDIRRDNRLENHLQNTKDSLCPEAAAKGEQQAWQRAIDIAMHAVLDQAAFMNETEALRDIRYYTSNRDYGEGYTPLRAPVLGADALNNPSCMQFWKTNDARVMETGGP